MKKQNLLISFSGGETSAYMLYFLTKEWMDRNKYNMAIVFANTGEENEETLKFVDNCSKLFDVNIVWVEANVNKKIRKGTTHKIVDFKTASRNGEPFEEVIKKYGIPNQAFSHCNREMKLRPIHSYIKNDLGWKNNYKTAIGIRYDEIDRMVVDRSTYNIIYPLIEFKKMTKQKINHWWSQQEFRLNLKGYQGNCKTCWKKSFKNLYTIAKENPNYFDFFKRMEDLYGKVTPLERKPILDDNGEIKMNTFFRGGKSVDEIMKESKTFYGKVIDSHKECSYQMDLFDETESCDIFSNCGDL
jgi:hypothetical protein